MSRKNTILVAVIINLSLLAALFFTATKQKEKTLPVDPTGFLVENEMVETAIAQESEPQIETRNEPQIVHVLPEAVEEKQNDPVKETPVKEEKHFATNKKLQEITVKKGDSLDKIAKLYGVSVDDIVDENELKTTIIRIGQSLKIPSVEKTATRKIKKAVVNGEYYTVKPGDNPWTIAMKHNIKVEDLLKMNNLNKEKAKKLRPGDKLRIR